MNLDQRLWTVIRYRFFLLAGIFPYLLGQAVAFNSQKYLNRHYFWLGFLGVFLALIGVELFNEYFDAKEGGDRIFSLEPIRIPHYFFHLALCSMLFAFFIGLYLTIQLGWPILLFSFLGFLAAYFYVGPPLKWAYRGLGEIVIALSYGPFMVFGSFYLQAKRIDLVPLFPSLICGMSLFCLALLNEIPDYYQDRLVGKKNLVVRLGKHRSIRLLSSMISSLFILLALGTALGMIPLLALVPFLILPWIVRSLTIVKKNCEDPEAFVSAINANVVSYLIIAFSLGIGYLGG